MAGTSFAHARLAVVVVLLFGFFTNPSLSAQVATGSIVGTVRDSSGEIVPGAQVTIREVNRNTTTTLITDASGSIPHPSWCQERTRCRWSSRDSRRGFVPASSSR
jgi:hypothetical protein